MSNTAVLEPQGTTAERAVCAIRRTHQAGVRARTPVDSACDREAMTEPLLTQLEVGVRHSLRSSRCRLCQQKRWRACNCYSTSPPPAAEKLDEWRATI